MAFLSSQDKTRIAEAVRDVERRTSGELVTVIAPASDGYRYIPLLWATLIALAFPVFWLPLGGDPGLLYPIQLTVFMAASVIFNWQPVRRFVIPRAVQRQRAERLAFEAFHRLGLHRTPHRAGVLLFVSVEERYVRILADSGIDDCVEDTRWQAIIDDFVAFVRRGEIAEGFLHAVDACGGFLVEHFPAQPGQQNSLPDVLIDLSEQEQFRR